MSARVKLVRACVVILVIGMLLGPFFHRVLGLSVAEASALAFVVTLIWVLVAGAIALERWRQ